MAADAASRPSLWEWACWTQTPLAATRAQCPEHPPQHAAASRLSGDFGARRWWLGVLWSSDRRRHHFGGAQTCWPCQRGCPARGPASERARLAGAAAPPSGVALSCLPRSFLRNLVRARELGVAPEGRRRLRLKQPRALCSGIRRGADGLTGRKPGDNNGTEVRKLAVQHGKSVGPDRRLGPLC